LLAFYNTKQTYQKKGKTFPALARENWDGRHLKDGTRADWPTSARAARLGAWERRGGGFCSSQDERAAW